MPNPSVRPSSPVLRDVAGDGEGVVGEYREGEKLPSHNPLSDEMGVAYRKAVQFRRAFGFGIAPPFLRGWQRFAARCAVRFDIERLSLIAMRAIRARHVVF